jgi:hypothetical protein
VSQLGNLIAGPFWWYKYLAVKSEMPVLDDRRPYTAVTDNEGDLCSSVCYCSIANPDQ